MDVKQIFLLIIFQGLPLGFVCQRGRHRYTVTALLGSCVELPCPNGFYEDKRAVWFVGELYNQAILNTKDSSSVKEEYRNRTSLVPGEKSCALRIDPVRREDENVYNAGSWRKRYSYETSIGLYVRDTPEDPVLSMPKYFAESHATTIRCFVKHTCGSSPPSLQWNKPGEIKNKTIKFSEYWREESALTYIPSYVDDGTPVQCTATYPNGQTTNKSAELKIYFAPKHVMVTITEKGRIKEGHDVNLVCTSISKPEVIKYEWYKGRNKTKLLYTGWNMTVYNVTRDMEPYSCTAINSVGRGESAPTEIPVIYDGGSSLSFIESYSNIILFATIGILFPLILVVLVYFIWRKRCRKVTSSEAPEAIYCNIEENDVVKDSEKFKADESPDATYCNIEQNYYVNNCARFMPLNSTQVTEGYGRAAIHYK